MLLTVKTSATFCALALIRMNIHMLRQTATG